ncbi:23S rRNA (adenine(2030)-N(6))-methyltransferase RlmJ [Alsobacter sp. R-9]
MNYRHAFHAGNFADVLKHAVLARVLAYLTQKDAPLRVIDTHAGIGVYDLASDEAGRTQEWRGGIGRLLDAALPPAAADLLAPYLEAIDDLRAKAGPLAYPGSPEIARRLTRRQDRLVLIEKHPRDVELLAEAMAGDRRAKVIALDGWTALNAYVPPPERRGLVLVDPPFEEAGELERMAAAAAKAWSKWSTGVYLLWYPVKDTREIDAFHRTVKQGPMRRVLRIELLVTDGRDPRLLNGSGLLVVNPPWTLAQDMAVLLPALSTVLRRDASAPFRCDWLVPED